MKSLLRPALLFVAIGLLLYAGLYAASEALVRTRGHSNPLFKVVQLREPVVDWIVLGASHAMPLDFDEVNAGLERASGQRIVQLAGPGTGPLYNRFVLERFLHDHKSRNLLYAVDSFTFYSRTWNEDRLVDAKLLRRTPWDATTATTLSRYVLADKVDVRAVLDYASGFSKVNNRERFAPDLWEGEAQFDRVAPASTTAIKKRIDYLYPDGTQAAARIRYLQVFATLLATAREHGVQVTVVKLPLPPAFRRRLPDEASFDDAFSALLKEQQFRWLDLSEAVPDAQLYFDTDHLNRKGIEALARGPLLGLLQGGAP